MGWEMNEGVQQMNHQENGEPSEQWQQFGGEHGSFEDYYREEEERYRAMQDNDEYVYQEKEEDYHTYQVYEDIDGNDEL